MVGAISTSITLKSIGGHGVVTSFVTSKRKADNGGGTIANVGGGGAGSTSAGRPCGIPGGTSNHRRTVLAGSGGTRSLEFPSVLTGSTSCSSTVSTSGSGSTSSKNTGIQGNTKTDGDELSSRTSSALGSISSVTSSATRDEGSAGGTLHTVSSLTNDRSG